MYIKRINPEVNQFEKFIVLAIFRAFFKSKTIKFFYTNQPILLNIK